MNKGGRTSVTSSGGKESRNLWEETRAQDLIMMVLNKELSLTAAAVRLGVDTNTFFAHLTENGKNKQRVSLLMSGMAQSAASMSSGSNATTSPIMKPVVPMTLLQQQQHLHKQQQQLQQSSLTPEQAVSILGEHTANFLAEHPNSLEMFAQAGGVLSEHHQHSLHHVLQQQQQQLQQHLAEQNPRTIDLLTPENLALDHSDPEDEDDDMDGHDDDSDHKPPELSVDMDVPTDLTVDNQDHEVEEDEEEDEHEERLEQLMGDDAEPEVSLNEDSSTALMTQYEQEEGEHLNNGQAVKEEDADEDEQPNAAGEESEPDNEIMQEPMEQSIAEQEEPVEEDISSGIEMEPTEESLPTEQSGDILEDSSLAPHATTSIPEASDN